MYVFRSWFKRQGASALFLLLENRRGALASFGVGSTALGTIGALQLCRPLVMTDTSALLQLHPTQTLKVMVLEMSLLLPHLLVLPTRDVSK